MVIHKGNLTNESARYFFCLLLRKFLSLTDVWFQEMLRSISDTQVMFIRESGLMFRTFAEFLFKMNFSRGAGGVYKMLLEIPEGWGVYFS